MSAVLVLTAALSAACGDVMRMMTGPTEVNLVTGQFAGSLSSGNSRFYSFTVSAPGSVAVTLASVTDAVTGGTVPALLRVGVGSPRGTRCSVAAEIETSAALVTQLVYSVNPSVYCIEVADPGGLSAPVNFAVRFVHP